MKMRKDEGKTWEVGEEGSLVGRSSLQKERPPPEQSAQTIPSNHIVPSAQPIAQAWFSDCNLPREQFFVQ